MERCAYCGEKVGDEALYVDDEVFCSDECVRDYGAHPPEANDDDLDDDDEAEEKGNDDDSYVEEEDY